MVPSAIDSPICGITTGVDMMTCLSGLEGLWLEGLGVRAPRIHALKPLSL
jgi:hypothetical protein